jgi:hypothetical protein
MQRSMLGRATLVVVVVVATIALTGESSVGETIQCRTSPGAPAPQGMHWYYRVDRTNNRHCWYTQSAGLPVHSQRNEMPSNPTPHIARERISAPLPTDTTAVCAENSNSDIMVMQSAKDRVGMDTSSSLNWARERRVLIHI